MTGTDQFVHAHVHTDYSALDGASKIDELVAEVVRLGQPAVAITDHGNTQGAYELWKACTAAGVNPIIGEEFYVAPGGSSRHGREKIFFGPSQGANKQERSDDVSDGGTYTHMTMWAETTEGMHNLFKMSTYGFLEGRFGAKSHPRIDDELMAQYGKGVIGSTGCPSGEVQTRLRLGQYKEAIEYAAKMQDILGKDNYYCEIMDHGLSIEKRVRQDLLKLAKELHIPLLATNDTHYTKKSDSEKQDHLLCIQTGSTIDDENRFRFSGDGYYIKSAAEMRRLFIEIPEACDNTLVLGERCHVEFAEGIDLMPKFDVPEGETQASFLEKEVIRLIPERVRGWEDMDEEKQQQYYQQGKYECSIIEQMGFPSYFLVVGDFVQWAKDQGIVVGPGRGCLAPDSTILTSKGMKPIKDIVAGDIVFDQQGNPVTVPTTFEYDTDEELVEIRISSTQGQKMTGNHKVLVEKAGTNSLSWYRADEVEIGDFVVQPKVEFPQVSDPIDYDLGKLLGLTLAEDNDTVPLYYRKEVSILTKGEKPEISELTKKLFNVEPRISAATSEGFYEYNILSTSFFHLVDQFYYDDDVGGRHKTISADMLGTPESFRRGLLDGLWQDRTRPLTIGSPDFVQALVGLLLSLGLSYRQEDSTFFLDRKTTYDGEYMYFPVESVRRVKNPSGKVYDFTVPTTNSYVTDSYVVHNSAGGCLVAYAMSITDIDPIKHNLIFERFLNPERVSMPDIDIDFDDRRRSEVIRYVAEKYGEDKVSQIITFGLMKAKSALKDAARITGHPYAVGEILSQKMPEMIMGKTMTLKGVFDPDDPRYPEAQDFRDLVEKGTGIYPAALFKEVVRVALGMEGSLRNTGIHAAGVLMSSKPIIDTIPLMLPKPQSAKKKKKAEETGEALEEIIATSVTQFDYPTCEALGLLKMDFLGLRNLTVISDAFKNIHKNHGISYTMEELIHSDLDDEKTYKLLQTGETLGVFQLDSSGIRSLLKLLRPTEFNDISAVLALYRPGPMGVNAHIDYADRKNGRKPVIPIHPELEEPLKDILGDTFSLITFQEQIMQVAQRVAGYSLGQADLLRRAMGKKKKEEMDKQYQIFSEGMKKKGYSKAAFETLWNVLLPFADYAFNRSHSAGYALLSYVTAWLKAHYPAEYMAALLTSVGGKPQTTALYLNECRKMGIEVTPPDIRLSLGDYNPQDGKIVFGLGSIRGLGEETVDEIIQSRTDSNYNDLDSMLASFPLGAMNKKVFDGLIHAGAFDAYGYSRRALETDLIPSLGAMKTINADKEQGTVSLFDAYEVELPKVVINDIPEYPKREKLSKERRMIGLYVSDHPLSNMGNVLQNEAERTVADIKAHPPQLSEGFGKSETTRIAGVITNLENKKTRKGDSMQIATLEDMTGEMTVLVFGSTLNEHGPLQEDAIYRISGSLRSREDEDPSMIANNYSEIEIDEATGQVPMWLKLRESQLSTESVGELRDFLLRHPGNVPVKISIMGDYGSVKNMSLDDNLLITKSSALAQGLMGLFGSRCFGKWA